MTSSLNHYEEGTSPELDDFFGSISTAQLLPPCTPLLDQMAQMHDATVWNNDSPFSSSGASASTTDMYVGNPYAPAAYASHRHSSVASSSDDAARPSPSDSSEEGTRGAPPFFDSFWHQNAPGSADVFSPSSNYSTSTVTTTGNIASPLPQNGTAATATATTTAIPHHQNSPLLLLVPHVAGNGSQGQFKQLKLVPATTVHNAGHDDDLDDVEKLREQRKQRNRQSAQASRVRRKNETETLRAQLDEANGKIFTLQAENYKLRERVAHLEGMLCATELAGKLHHPDANSEEGNGRKRAFPFEGSNAPGFPKSRTIAAAATTGTCFMLFLLAFSFQPPAALLPLDKVPSNLEHVPHTAGRLLDSRPSLHSLNSTFVNGTTATRNGTTLLEGCGTLPSWLNSTEAMELRADLQSWVERHEQVQQLLMRRGQSPFSQKEEPLLLPGNDTTTSSASSSQKPRKRPASAVAKLERAARERTWRHLTQIKGDPEALLELGTKKQLEQLERLLRRRNDTLYYFATATDYLLLPPTIYTDKAATRPRVSLVLPALSVVATNGTENVSTVTFIRIDCEVLATGRINLPRKLFTF